MSFEIELKAHIKESDVDRICSYLKNKSSSSYLGPINKEDIYWALPSDTKTFFRTRLEESTNGSNICFTAKPFQGYKDNVECNKELEFHVPANEWNSVIDFCNGLNLQVCRRKYKKGYNFLIHSENMDIHCELLDVKYIGWFIESEIIVDSDDNNTRSVAKKVLLEHFEELSIGKDSIETKSYRQLLLEVGHLLG